MSPVLPAPLAVPVPLVAPTLLALPVPLVRPASRGAPGSPALPVPPPVSPTEREHGHGHGHGDAPAGHRGGGPPLDEEAEAALQEAREMTRRMLEGDDADDEETDRDNNG